MSYHLLRTFESATIWPLTFGVRATHFIGWSRIPWYALLVSAALVHLCQQTTSSPLWISRLHVAGQRLETVASPDFFRLKHSPLRHLWSSFSHDCMQKKLPLKKAQTRHTTKGGAPTLQDVAWIVLDGWCKSNIWNSVCTLSIKLKKLVKGRRGDSTGSKAVLYLSFLSGHVWHGEENHASFLDNPPSHTHTRLHITSSLTADTEVGIPAMLFFFLNRNYKSHRVTSSWQPNLSGIKPKRWKSCWSRRTISRTESWACWSPATKNGPFKTAGRGQTGAEVIVSVTTQHPNPENSQVSLPTSASFTDNTN